MRRRRLAGIGTLACAALLLSGCGLFGGGHSGKGHPGAPAGGVTAASLGPVSVSAPPGTKATMKPAAVTTPQVRQLRPLLMLGFAATTPVDIETSTAFPPAGVTLRRTFGAPLPAGATATFAYFDDQLDTWLAVPSVVAADRRSVTATVHHLSVWTEVVGGTAAGVTSFVSSAKAAGTAVVNGAISATQSAAEWAQRTGADVADALYYDVGKVFSTRVSAPSCTGGLPYWASDVTTIATDRNNSILFCSGHDPKQPDLVVIKARVNRGFAFPLALSSKTDWTYNSTYNQSDVGAMLDAVTGPDKDVRDGVAELFGGGSELVGPGGEFSVGISSAEADGVKDGQPALELKVPGPLTFLTSVLAQLLTVQGTESDSSWVSATIGVAACAKDIGRTDSPLTAAAAVVSCFQAFDEDIARDLATALVKDPHGKLSATDAGRLAGRLVGRISLILAVVGPILDSLDYAAAHAFAQQTRTATIAMKVFKPTNIVVLRPFSSSGVLQDGYSITPSSRSTVDCSFPEPSPSGLGRGTIWCGSTADNAFACWPDPSRSSSIVCTYDPASKRLQRVATTQPVPANLAQEKHPEPALIELVDGSRWWLRIGGAWSPTYPGTFPNYGCMSNCQRWSNSSADWALIATDHSPTLDTSHKVFTVQVSKMASDENSIPKPLTMPVKTVWWVGGH